MITVGQALERVAERTIENRERWKRSLLQRRYTPSSIYGIRFYNELDAVKHFETHFSIMPSLLYWMRFGFNLYVTTITPGASIDPDTFKFEIGDPSIEGDQGQEEEGMVNITPYLLEQSNEWVDGSGYFPTINWEDGNETNSEYNILDVCSMLEAEGRREESDYILEPGVKLVRISCPTPCNIEWIPDISYTTVNR